MRFLFFILSLCYASLSIGQLPTDFYDQLVSKDWDLPVGILFEDSGTGYAWEKGGKVFIIDTSGNKIATPLIDIHEEVGNWRDHGLLSFCLDPEFRTNGHFYLLYAVNRHYLEFYGTLDYIPDSIATKQASIGRVTRYTADPATNFTSTIPGSRKVLLGEDKTTGIPLIHESHSIGTILFGEDGSLLISCGDGNINRGGDFGGDKVGSYASDALAFGVMKPDEDVGLFRSLYLDSHNGKVLRINPETGDGFPSNPFYDPDAPRSARSRVWAYGFRNPFRMALRSGTGGHDPSEGNPGVLYVGDVGGGQWEEINIVDQAGLNFGWPLKEGIIPVWENWNAPTLNLGAKNPLFGVNGCQNEYFSFKQLYAQSTEDGQHFFPNPCDPAQPIPADAFPAIEVPPAVSWSHNEYNLPAKTVIPHYDQDGNVQPMSIKDPTSGVSGEVFDGTSSIVGGFYEAGNFPDKYYGSLLQLDYSGWIKVFFFDQEHRLEKIEPFQDGQNLIVHLAVNPKDGCVYYVGLKDGGEIRKICYGGNPPPIAIAKADKNFGSSPLTVNLDASDSYDPIGLPIEYEWNLGEGVIKSGQNNNHTFTAPSNAPYAHHVVLKVTDSLGISSEDSLLISLNNTPPDVNITSPKDGTFYPMNGGTFFPLRAEVTDQEHSDTEMTYKWETFLHHNTHFHPEPPVFEKNSQTFITPLGCEDDATYYYRVRLTVTDDAKLQTIKESIIYPFCEDPFFELENLNAEPQINGVEISWNVISADDVIAYEVQSNTTNQTIGRIDATSNTNYQIIDSAPIIGLNSYRIKVIRADEVFEYSDNVTAKYPLIPTFNIFPNPVKDQLTVQIKEAKSELVQIVLYDMSGRQILSSFWKATLGEISENNISLQDYPSGVYIFEIRQGDDVLRGKIVVDR